MSASALEMPITDRSGLRDALREFLRQSGAVSVAAMARYLDVDPVMIRAEIDELVACGQVELLRPVVLPGHRADDLEYCRWIRATDDDYAWQSLLFRRLEFQPLRAGDAKLALLVD